MTLPRLAAFNAVWAVTPPLRVMLAGLLQGLSGQRPGRSPSSGPVFAAPSAPKRDLQDYLEAFGGAGISAVDKRRAR